MANTQTTVPIFTAFQVLEAQQLNDSAATGVPVFATTVTRDAAFGGLGEKALAQGQLCYLEAILQVAAAVIALTAAMVYLEIKFSLMSKAFDKFGNAIMVVTGPLGVLIGSLRKLVELKDAVGSFNIGGINIPGFADGGIVTRPTLAMVGEKGPEAIIPLSQMGGMGGGVTVNVTGGLSTSAEIGQAVVNAIRAYNRSAGPAQIQVA